MHYSSKPISPVSPVTSSPIEHPSRRFFTNSPTGSTRNHLSPLPPPPSKFPPRTSSLPNTSEISQNRSSPRPIPYNTSEARNYTFEVSTFTPPRPWNSATQLYNENSSVNISSTGSSSNPYYPPTPPLSSSSAHTSSSLPLRITTSLTSSLPFRIGRSLSRSRDARKKDKKGIPSNGNNTNLTLRHRSPFPKDQVPNNFYTSHHSSSSSPAFSGPGWGSEGEDTEEDTTPKHYLGSYARDRGIYGQVRSGEGLLVPDDFSMQSNASSPVSAKVGYHGIYPSRRPANQNSLLLLLELFQLHNTMTRIVKWLRRDDLLNLVSLSRSVREAILLLPIGLSFDKQGIGQCSCAQTVFYDDETDNEEEEVEEEEETENNDRFNQRGMSYYQISQLLPLSPLTLNVESVKVPPSPEWAQSLNRFGSEANRSGRGHLNLRKNLSTNSLAMKKEYTTTSAVPASSSQWPRPNRSIPPSWNDKEEFSLPVQRGYEFEYKNSQPPSNAEIEADYAEKLGRLVWLLTLTTTCKVPHRTLDKKIKLKFCVWCGECVCEGCDISSYLPHSHRLRRLCLDCWTFSGNGTLDEEEQPPALGSSTNLPFQPMFIKKKGKTKNLLCTCQLGDEWICPDCDNGGNELEDKEDLAQCKCWLCEKDLGGGTPQKGQGYAGTRREDIWRMCLWCGKRTMMIKGPSMR